MKDGCYIKQVQDEDKGDILFPLWYWNSDYLKDPSSEVRCCCQHSIELKKYNSIKDFIEDDNNKLFIETVGDDSQITICRSCGEQLEITKIETDLDYKGGPRTGDVEVSTRIIIS